MKALEEYYGKKKRDKKAVLTAYEKKISKALKLKGVREQDILYILNIGRETTLNSGRFSEVNWDAVDACSNEELEQFEQTQRAWDFKTGLNPILNKVDRILIKSKEAMLQAVAIFNNPTTYFSTESFLTLANIAWLYLFQAFCEQKNIKYHNTDNSTQALSYMLQHNIQFKEKINLEESVSKNIEFIISLRDNITHEGGFELPSQIIMKLQANCINYNDTLIRLFGKQNGLHNIFSIALQFASISLDQSKKLLQNNNCNKNLLNFVEAFDKNLSDDVLNDVKYQFTIAYVLLNGRKVNTSDAVKFYAPGTEDYENVEHVLIKEVFGFDRYKYTITSIKNKLEKIDNTQKYRNKILELIERHDLRDCKRKKSKNVSLVQAFPSGNKGTTWKYTEEFLDLCKQEILGIGKND